MTAKLTPATVRALLDRATKGPWAVSTTGLMNDGSRPVVSDECRIGTADMHADVKPRDAWRSECLERDANAALIASAPDLAAAYLEAMAVIEEIAGTKWLEDEPASGWIPDGAEGYVGEMESFCNWATERARAFLAKHKEQEA